MTGTHVHHHATAEGHDHVFLGRDHERNARRTWLVIAITAATMVVEITAGTIYGSMALVADGWHMSTHAAAMLITALAYGFASRHAHDARFSFGTGKIGDLAAFASSVVLAIVALLIGWESLMRLYNPVEISFPQAITVAVVGLAVNLICAFLLGGDHSHHHHGHGHDHHGHDHHAHDGGHHHHGHGRDNNIRAAYLHVLADALTSLMAIVALAAGSIYGWQWMDPAMGIVGALVIARWSVGLMRDSGRVLVDYVPENDTLPENIRAAVETDGDRITDLHVWQVGPGHHAAIVAVASDKPCSTKEVKERLGHIGGLSHVTVEIDPAR